MTSYDAVLLVSFGGPEGPQDVMPFLRNVTAGRGVPDERLAEVAQHYELFGGVSPINAQNRELLAVLQDILAPRRVYWGNRNWTPYLPDTVARMRSDGIRRAAVFITAAYASYSSCRQYREDLAAAEPGDLRLDKLRHYYNHPGFITAQTDQLVALGAALEPDARLVFTAHSIPSDAARTSGPAGGAYPAQLGQAAALVSAQLRERTPWRGEFELAWQSRSGPPNVPWLEPDINDTLESLAARGARDVVAVPVGFVSDHVEVRYDLDIEAAETAQRLGMHLLRAGTVGTSRPFIEMVHQLVVERETVEFGEFGDSGDSGGKVSDLIRPALGGDGPSHDVCPLTCCPGRIRQPAAAGDPLDMQAENRQ